MSHSRNNTNLKGRNKPRKARRTEHQRNRRQTRCEIRLALLEVNL